MRQFLSLISLFLCLTSAAFAQKDKFSNFTVTPASGTSITDKEFCHIVLTFPDVKNVKYTRSGIYYIFPETEWNEHGFEGSYIGKPHTTFLDEDGVCEISGNAVTVNIKERIPESGNYVLVFNYASFMDADDDLSSKNQDELVIKYHIDKTPLVITTSPSTSETVSMVDLWPIVVTFPEAQKVTLLDDFMEHATAKIIDPKGNEISTLVSRFYDDKWTVDGNSMSLNFTLSDRQKFTEEGEYTIVFTEGSVILDGLSQDEIKITYNVTLPERPAEGPVNIAYQNYVDDENNLYFTVPAQYEWTGSMSFIGNEIKDINGNVVGRMNNLKEVEGEKNMWYINMRFFDAKDPKMTYTVNIDESLLTLRDVYYVEHETTASTVTFYGSKEAAGISDVTLGAAEKAYYTLGGVLVAKPEPGAVYIERVNGKSRKIAASK